MTPEQPTPTLRAHSICCYLGVAACGVNDGKILLGKEAAGKHVELWGRLKDTQTLMNIPCRRLSEN